MATGGKLEVQIGADITDFEKKIKEVEFDIKELSKVKLEKIKLGLDTKEITAQIKDAKANLTGLKTALKDTGSQIGGQFTKQAANGSNALMQFSRIAQDAPYGIMGIGNNITTTVEAFGHLKNSTGTTGGALKAMASSLMGSGGILLGVSLLTTGFTLLAQSGLSVGDIIDKVTGKFDEFGGAIKTASEEGVKATAGEVFGLKALVSASQNKALSDKDRLIAVDNLQKQYPAYFGNLSKEQIMTGNLTGVVKELTKALLDRAIAEKLAGASADIQLKLYSVNAKLVKQKEETLKLEKELSTLVGNSSKDELYADNQKFIAVTNLNGQIRNSKILENEYRVEISKGTKAIEQRQNVIDKLTASSIKLEQAQAPKGKKANQTFSAPQVTGVENNIIPAPLFDVAGIAVFNGQVDQYKNKIKELPGVIKTSMGEAQVAIDMGNLNMIEAMMQFSDSANQIIQGAISETFFSLGTMIGNSMVGAEGGLEGAGKAVLGILGNFLTQFGQLMIETGIGLIIAKKMIQSGNGYAMIAGGIALVAVGAAFSASSKKSQQNTSNSFGGGGTSTATGSGANNSSSTSGSTGGWSGGGNGTVVFEIAGTSLIGVLNNTTERNLRIGGRG